EASEGEQRADRKIDARGQNDESHADREQAGDRHLPHHVEQVDLRQEARLDDREQQHQRDEEQRRREARDEAEDVYPPILRRFQPRLAHEMSPLKPLTRATPLSCAVIIAIRISCVALVRAISPVTRPSRIVTMRSETARISGSSDAMTITAMRSED